MRLAAFLLVIAVALAAFLVLRAPPSDTAGIAPDSAAAPVSEPARPPVELVRGERTSAASNPVAPVAPRASKVQAPPPALAPAPVKPGKKGQDPLPGNGIDAVAVAVEGIDDAGLAQKYDRTTPEERRQAIASIQQLFDSTPNLDPKEVVVLKHEIEWLQQSLDG